MPTEQQLAAGGILASRYQLEQPLGRGGMGDVWRALDLELDRRVAVKVLRVNQIGDGETRDTALARFRREGRAAARLNHVHIATVYDRVAHPDQPFLVLELLAGPDLAGLLKKHPGGLPIGTVLEYGAQAAEGLAAAHKVGVVHRDVKPSNLMLDGSGTVKICDFGIARVAGATAGLTEGIRIGTVYYMPPEQWLGEPVTDAADVYALGATLFHLLTGRVPFPGDPGEVMGQHLHKAPPPPSSLRPAIPQALDAYLLTLLAKAPSVRPPARTIAAHLRALISVDARAEVPLNDAELTGWAPLLPLPPAEEQTLRSMDSVISTQIEFVNQRSEAVRIYWLDYQGSRTLYTQLAPGAAYIQQTYVSHPWIITNTAETPLVIFQPTETPGRATVY
ncbi:protein kinase [Streptomyces sp. NPDC005803]|uniref:protein kinase domain-containing protein n=1 Tax=Streptomyces sp. NPDC005803 TaxID=3154297 RepID=UPI0033E954DB